MKHILTLIAVAFTLSLGACAAKQSGTTSKSSCCGDCAAKPAKKH